MGRHRGMGKERNQQEYGHFLGLIKESIRAHQLRAMRAVNRELVALYWEIGKAIQKKQESLGLGKAVVETLVRDLQAAFPGRNGFSARNLWRMRDLCCAHPGMEELPPLVAEIGWSKACTRIRRETKAVSEWIHRVIKTVCGMGDGEVL